MISRYKSLRTQYPRELAQVSIHPLREGLENGEYPIEEIDTTVNLDMLEALLRQQRALNACRP